MSIRFHNLKAILLSAFAFFPILECAAQISVVPQPREIQLVSGKATLGNSPRIYIQPKAKIEAGYVKKQFGETGITPTLVKKASKADIAVTVNSRAIGHKEGYTLHIDNTQVPAVSIVANDHSGAVYALETLRQLLQEENGKLTLSNCTINDWPEFSWRSFMLDESRHFHGKEMVKRLLDEMVRLKMNIFHWHLVDEPGWRIEIKGYPRLTEVGSLSDFTHQFPGAEEWKRIYPDRERSYYTQDEIREVVAYATARGINIVPEIEIPAHCSASTIAYPEIGTTNDEGKQGGAPIYDVISPAYKKFIKTVFSQVLDLFPTKVIHIGGDEANYTRWQNNGKIKAFMKEKGLKTFPDMQLYAINEAAGYLKTKGVRIIGWNEITGDNIRGEKGRGENSAIQLKPGTIVQFWDGSPEFAKKAIAKGYEVVNSNRHETYLDYFYDYTTLEVAYKFNPYFKGLTDEQNKQVIGLGCQMWGERTPNSERLYYQIFPRFGAYAEDGWTPEENKNYADFVRRMSPIEKIWKQKGYFTGQPSYTDI